MTKGEIIIVLADTPHGHSSVDAAIVDREVRFVALAN